MPKSKTLTSQQSALVKMIGLIEAMQGANADEELDTCLENASDALTNAVDRITAIEEEIETLADDLD